MNKMSPGASQPSINLFRNICFLLFSKSFKAFWTGYWLFGFGVLVKGMFFPMLGFPPGNETKLFSTICGIELGKALPGDDCSEFMLVPLLAITSFGGNNCWVEGLQIINNSPCWDEISCKIFCGLFSVSTWLSVEIEWQSVAFKLVLCRSRLFRSFSDHSQHQS